MKKIDIKNTTLIDDFLSQLKENAERKGTIEEVNGEINYFKERNELDYLYYISEFCNALKEIGIIYFVTYHDKESQILKTLDLDNMFELNIVNEYEKYAHKTKNMFYFHISNYDYQMCVSILKSIIDIEEYDDDSSIKSFGENYKYLLIFVQDCYLGKLSKIHSNVIKKVKLNDPKVIEYMLQPYDGGYNMPHLNNIVLGMLKPFYTLLNAAKPKSLEDLVHVLNLRGSVISSYAGLEKLIKENGINNLITSREQLYSILVDGYDIDIKTVDDIRRCRQIHLDLSESHELILKSNGLPDYLIEEIKNIDYIGYSIYSKTAVALMYYLAYIKFYFPDEFKKTIPPINSVGYVGLFFNANSNLRTMLQSVDSFDRELRFFDLCNSTDLEDELKQHLQGRVIYDNYLGEYIVFMNKSLMSPSNRHRIISIYNLKKEKVTFISDDDPISDITKKVIIGV